MNDPKKSPPIGVIRKDIKVMPAGSSDNGESMWMIFDPVNDSYFKIYEKEYKIISGLNRQFTLDEYLEYLNTCMHLSVTKGELIQIISFLKNNGLMEADFFETEQRIQKVKHFKKSMLFHSILSYYLFFKIPIWRPDKFLDRTVDYIRTIFNKWVICILVLLSVAGYLSIIVNWNKFINTMVASLTYEGFIRYGIIIIIIKFFHELAHAYTAKLEGVRVRYIGIGVIFFFPRLYTDLTDSWQITNRYKKALMDGAGILLEIIIGGLAALYWLNSIPSVANTIAYYVFAVSIISTIFVNGNPLIRFDGYYLLSDLLGVDNLQKKSIELWEILLDRIIFGIKFTKSDIINKFGKKYPLWLIYGVCAFIYRLFLYTSIVIFVYSYFTKALGIVMALLEIQLMFIRPIMQQVKRMKIIRKSGVKKNKIISAVSVSILLLILIIPFPWEISLPALSVPKFFAVGYIQNGAFFKNLLIKDGDTVFKGELIAEFYNPYLDFDYQNIIYKIEESEIELDQIERNRQSLDLVNIKKEQVSKLKHDLADLETKRKNLKFYAPYSGIFHLQDRNLNTGKWMSKGDILGFVKDTRFPEVLAFVKENDINKLKVGRKISIVLNRDIKHYEGEIVSIDNVPFSEWGPSPLLDIYGGPINVINIEKYSFKTLEKYYCVKIEPDSVTDYRDLIPVGRSGTAYVRVYKSLVFELLKRVISSLRKELTF